MYSHEIKKVRFARTFFIYLLSMGIEV